MLWIYAPQLQISGFFVELHINPAMGMAFPKVVTDRWLSNDMEMLLVLCCSAIHECARECMLEHAFAWRVLLRELSHPAFPGLALRRDLARG